MNNMSCYNSQIHRYPHHHTDIYTKHALTSHIFTVFSQFPTLGLSNNKFIFSYNSNTAHLFSLSIKKQELKRLCSNSHHFDFVSKVSFIINLLNFEMSIYSPNMKPFPTPNFRRNTINGSLRNLLT